MSTPREIFLEMLKPDGKPERILDQYEALAMMTGDPINKYLRGNRVRGTTSVDRWGTTILFPADAPGPMPDTGDELKVLRDITRWREYVHAPDIEANCSEGWEEIRAKPRPCAAKSWSPGSWARASSSSATSSWALRTRSPTSTSTPTRCTS